MGLFYHEGRIKMILFDMSESLNLAKKYLRQNVEVTIDRQLGTRHPKWGFIYEVNYGYLKGIKAPDGEDLDAYILKIDTPVEKFKGKVVAIVHRLKDDDDKLVVVPDGQNVTDDEIKKYTEFQEKFFEHEIIR
jgi:inorganic pyrophosphatase